MRFAVREKMKRGAEKIRIFLPVPYYWSEMIEGLVDKSLMMRTFTLIGSVSHESCLCDVQRLERTNRPVYFGIYCETFRRQENGQDHI